MGQKVNPISFRTGIKIKGVINRTASGTPTSNVKNWLSRWFAPKRQYGPMLIEDYRIREHVKKEFYVAGIPGIEIERSMDMVTVFIFAARPGIIIGKKGANVDRLKGDLETIAGKKVDLKIIELQKPELEAQLVAESVAEQLQKRASFRRTIKKAADLTLAARARGVKIQVAGRLGGAEMARREYTLRGSIPLTTLKADISYGTAEAKTTYGIIGVKCWIYRGDLIEDKETF
jgi:small subunit ribosomal protein S3